MALPATPSFSLAEANSIVEIEVQADQLLGYIDKLTTLADRACTTAIRQSQTAHLIDVSRHGEINDLRKKLETDGAPPRADRKEAGARFRALGSAAYPATCPSAQAVTSDTKWRCLNTVPEACIMQRSAT